MEEGCCPGAVRHNASGLSDTMTRLRMTPWGVGTTEAYRNIVSECTYTAESVDGIQPPTCMGNSEESS